MTMVTIPELFSSGPMWGENINDGLERIMVVGLRLTDSQAEKQAKLDALGAAGGGLAVMEPGVHTLPFMAHGTAGFFCCLRLPANVELSARGATIKLANSQTQDIAAGQGAYILLNTALTGGDENISVVGLTVDGNAANQTKNHGGIVFYRVRHARCTDVRVKNVRGTGSAPPNETFHFDAVLSTDVTWTRCIAEGSSGSTATGFSANNTTNATWTDCTAYGMTVAHGFTAYQCVNPAWLGCRSFLNAGIGFNCEESLGPSWTNCYSGGQAALGASPYPYAASTDLGNAGSGFVVNGCAQSVLTGCTSRKNTGSGIFVTAGAAAYGPCSGRVSSCVFTDNDFAGVSFPAGSETIEKLWRFDGSSMYSGNTLAAFETPQGFQGGPGGGGVCTGAPAVPADGVGVVNPYPFAVVVYIQGGTTNLRRINDVDMGNTATALRLNVNDKITIFHSVAPTWTWVPA